LRKYLKPGPRSNLRPAHALGRRAVALCLETLDLTRFHERALLTLVLPGYSSATRGRMIRRAGTFFAEAIAPIENTHRAARQANDQLVHLNQALHQRSAALATPNLKLKREIAQRKLAEESLRKSEQHYAQLLEQSRLMGRPARAEWQ